MLAFVQRTINDTTIMQLLAITISNCNEICLESILNILITVAWYNIVYYDKSHKINYQTFTDADVFLVNIVLLSTDHDIICSRY